MQLLDGKALAGTVKNEIREEVGQLLSQGRRPPKLVAVLVGSDGPSQTYVGAKEKDCTEVGFDSEVLHLSKDVSEAELMDTVGRLNEDAGVDGFIVQLPLPSHMNDQRILEAIRAENVGKMALGLEGFVPATPAGIVELLKRHQIDTEGKLCVVIGRSSIVGMPMALLMGKNAQPGNCTVVQTHSRTKDLKGICAQADILIAALGRPCFVGEEMVKQGAVVIDVGISRIEDPAQKTGFRLVGDVDFEVVAHKCSYITPVPGGVGPMTRTALLQNTLKAYYRRQEK
jgi:methylenetetrahydrofolate dehydrogenase (NADP+)/methenyltetrahydrofolate cyclohydrolase